MSVTGELVIPRNPVEKTDAPSGGKNESEGEEWLERGDHPLMIDLVLETLFGFVRRCDLKSCRVVSKKWNLHTIPHMRSTFKVTIHGNHFPQGHPRSIHHFVNLFNSNELGIPITSFGLFPFCTRYGVGHEFLQLCGETATEIKMNLLGPEEEVHTIEDVSELLGSCPNLQILGFPYNFISRSGSIVKLFPYSNPTFPSLKKITFGNDYDEKPMWCCPSGIEELLTAAPNASDIVVHDLDDNFAEREDEGNGDENASKISVVLNCIEKLRMESSIQSLSLYGVRGQHIDQLVRMAEKENGLKLRSLSFVNVFSPAGVFSGVSTQLVTNFRHTLQYLNAGAGSSIEIIFMEIGTMPNLKSLSLLAGWEFFPRRVDLNEKFPALETLDLGVEYAMGLWANGFSQFQPSHTLKALTVRNDSIRIQTLHDIIRVFPNLTKLNVCVGEDGAELLRQIWSQMPQLESLAVHGQIGGIEELELDSLFTGIPAQTLQGLIHVVSELERMRVEERREMIHQLQNDNRRLPSIQSLTKLTQLKFCLRGGNGNRDPSDLTVYLAFYSMKHLRHLHVISCMFTKTCCEILLKETELETWRFENRESRNIIPKFVPQSTTTSN